MGIAQVFEISATSEESFEDAIRTGIEEAGEKFDNVSGAWIKEQKVTIEDGEIVEFNVNMQVTAVLDEQSGEDEEEEDDTQRQRSQSQGRSSGQRSQSGGGGNVIQARKQRREE